MDHTHVRAHAARQHEAVARAQLIDDGWSPDQVDRWCAGVRSPYPGVHVLGWSPLTDMQRWWAATLTAPNTVLGQASAAAFWAIRDYPGRFVTVIRPGRRGRNRYADLLVSYSATILEDTVHVDGLPVATPPRVLLDLWPHLGAADRRRTLAECLRLGRATPEEIVALTLRHRRRRGASELRDAAARYARLPFTRCKSPAEAQALIVLDRAGIEIPVVNGIFAGGEADLCWPDLWLIIEIDGPGFHVLRDADARKEAAWRAAGFTVLRIPSDVVFFDPALLVTLATRG